MFTKKQILGDPEIAGFLKTNVGVSKAVIRAAEKLEGNSDAIPALKKVLPALSQKKVEVFFSYRKKDEEAAATIVQILREPAGNLNITYMVEFK